MPPHRSSTNWFHRIRRHVRLVTVGIAAAYGVMAIWTVIIGASIVRHIVFGGFFPSPATKHTAMSELRTVSASGCTSGVLTGYGGCKAIKNAGQCVYRPRAEVDPRYGNQWIRCCDDGNWYAKSADPLAYATGYTSENECVSAGGVAAPATNPPSAAPPATNPNSASPSTPTSCTGRGVKTGYGPTQQNGHCTNVAAVGKCIYRGYAGNDPHYANQWIRCCGDGFWYAKDSNSQDPAKGYQKQDECESSNTTQSATSTVPATAANSCTQSSSCNPDSSCQGGYYPCNAGVRGACIKTASCDTNPTPTPTISAQRPVEPAVPGGTSEQTVTLSGNIDSSCGMNDMRLAEWKLYVDGNITENAPKFSVFMTGQASSVTNFIFENAKSGTKYEIQVKKKTLPIEQLSKPLANKIIIRSNNNNNNKDWNKNIHISCNAESKGSVCAPDQSTDNCPDKSSGSAGANNRRQDNYKDNDKKDKLQISSVTTTLNGSNVIFDINYTGVALGPIKFVQGNHTTIIMSVPSPTRTGTSNTIKISKQLSDTYNTQELYKYEELCFDIQIGDSISKNNCVGDDVTFTLSFRCIFSLSPFCALFAGFLNLDVTNDDVTVTGIINAHTFQYRPSRIHMQNNLSKDILGIESIQTQTLIMYFNHQFPGVISSKTVHQVTMKNNTIRVNNPLYTKIFK